MARDGMILDKRICDRAAMYGINSQLESQQSELHRAHQWACQAQIESRRMFEELTTKKAYFIKRVAPRIEELWRISCRDGKSSTVENR